MPTPLVVFLSVVGTVLLAAPWVVLLVLRRPPTGRKAAGAGRESSLEARLAALEVRVAGLPGLWEEERKRAERAAERERYHARRRAQAERDESDDDDDADDDDGGSHAGRGPAQGMLPLHEGMGADPGSEPEHIRRARAQGYPWSFLTGRA